MHARCSLRQRYKCKLRLQFAWQGFLVAFHSQFIPPINRKIQLRLSPGPFSVSMRGSWRNVLSLHACIDMHQSVSTLAGWPCCISILQNNRNLPFQQCALLQVSTEALPEHMGSSPHGSDITSSFALGSSPKEMGFFSSPRVQGVRSPSPHSCCIPARLFSCVYIEVSMHALGRHPSPRNTLVHHRLGSVLCVLPGSCPRLIPPSAKML